MKIEEKLAIWSFALIALTLLVWLFQSLLPVLILSAVVAMACDGLVYNLPWVKNSAEKLKLKRHQTSFILCYTFIFLLVFLLIYLVLRTSQSVTSYLPALVDFLQSLNQDQIEQFIQQILGKHPIVLEWFDGLSIDRYSLFKGMSGMTSFLLTNIYSALAEAVNWLFSLSLFLLCLFFLFKDGTKVRVYFGQIIPLQPSTQSHLLKSCQAYASLYLIGVVGVALIQGLSFGMLTLFLGLDAVYLGLVFALASFIPVVGASLVWVAVMGYFFYSGQGGHALIVGFYGLVVSGVLIDNVLRPTIYKMISALFKAQSLRQNHFLVFLATLAGLMQFGIWGLVLGPLLVSVIFLVLDILIEFRKSSHT